VQSLIPLILFWLISGLIRNGLRQPPASRRERRTPQPPGPERPVMVKPVMAKPAAAKPAKPKPSLPAFGRPALREATPAVPAAEFRHGAADTGEPAAPANLPVQPTAAQPQHSAGRQVLGALSARDFRFGIAMAEVLGPPRCLQPYRPPTWRDPQ